MSVEILSADFYRAVSRFDGLPQRPLPEIAFIGRSNAGKSSLINRLVKRKNLAKTSSTPGRTQELNYFETALKPAGEKERRLFLVDLPGFGYAKFSKEKREKLSVLTVQYLREHESLKLICLLNDSKRLPEAEELSIQEIAASAGVPLMIILTKCDRLKPAELRENRRRIAAAYHLEADSVFESGESFPATPLWQHMLQIIF